MDNHALHPAEALIGRIVTAPWHQFASYASAAPIGLFIVLFFASVGDGEAWTAALWALFALIAVLCSLGIHQLESIIDDQDTALYLGSDSDSDGGASDGR